jgi:hypothetical protein
MQTPFNEVLRKLAQTVGLVAPDLIDEMLATPTKSRVGSSLSSARSSSDEFKTPTKMAAVGSPQDEFYTPGKLARLHSTPSRSQKPSFVSRAHPEQPPQETLAMMVRGMTFTKYANGKGRPYLADVFFAQDEHTLYWCRSGQRQRTAKRSIPFEAITEIYQGKQTKAFGKGPSRQALADRCCSIITAHRTLDLEASTREGRDAFLYGIHTVLFGKQAKLLASDDRSLAREYKSLKSKFNERDSRLRDKYVDLKQKYVELGGSQRHLQELVDRLEQEAAEALLLRHDSEDLLGHTGTTAGRHQLVHELVCGMAGEMGPAAFSPAEGALPSSSELDARAERLEDELAENRASHDVVLLEMETARDTHPLEPEEELAARLNLAQHRIASLDAQHEVTPLQHHSDTTATPL